MNSYQSPQRLRSSTPRSSLQTEAGYFGAMSAGMPLQWLGRTPSHTNLTVVPAHFVPIQHETRNMSLTAYRCLIASLKSAMVKKRICACMCVIWNSRAGVFVWCFRCFPSLEKSSFHGVFPSTWTCLSPYFLCFDQSSPRCLFGMYGTELLFHQWFLREAAACRSTPEDADLFYVPSLGTWLALTFEFCRFHQFSSVKPIQEAQFAYAPGTVIVYKYCTCTVQVLTPSCPVHARL